MFKLSSFDIVNIINLTLTFKQFVNTLRSIPIRVEKEFLLNSSLPRS